jgi:hypothetical protein
MFAKAALDFCANLTLGTVPIGRSGSRIDPLLRFTIGPMNGREARESDLRLKANSGGRLSPQIEIAR